MNGVQPEYTIEENKVSNETSPIRSDNDHVLHFLRLPNPRVRTISE